MNAALPATCRCRDCLPWPPGWTWGPPVRNCEMTPLGMPIVEHDPTLVEQEAS